MPFTIPSPTHNPGDPNFVPDINNEYAATAAIAGFNILNSAYAGGADPTGVTDSTAAINAAIAAANTAGGGKVLVPAGTYLVSGTLPGAPHVLLEGQAAAVSLGIGTPPAPANAPRIVAAASWAPSSATGVISFQSKTPGGWSVTAQGSGVANIVIDCSANSSANLNGIWFQGPVYDCHLTDVMVYKAGGAGVITTSFTEAGIGPTFAYHMRLTRCSAVDCAASGFDLTNWTDSDALGCLSFGNTVHGWRTAYASNARWLGCRSEWNGQDGYHVVTNAGSGFSFADCSTDNNAFNGFNLSGLTPNVTGVGGAVRVTGGRISGDGRNSGSGGGGYAGIAVSSCTAPILISDVEVLQQFSTSSSTGPFFPQYGLSMSGNTLVSVADSLLQGNTAGWHDGGSNTTLLRSNVTEQAGNPASLTTTLSAQAANVPQPDDQNLLAWAYDPAFVNGTQATTTGQILLVRVILRVPATVTNVLCYIGAGGNSGLTSGQNWAGLYTSAGSQIDTSTDRTTAWNSATINSVQTIPLQSTHALAAGTYYVALVANGSTIPAWGRAGQQSGSLMNAGLSAAAYRCAIAGTGTTLPASITMSSNTSPTPAYWAALS